MSMLPKSYCLSKKLVRIHINSYPRSMRFGPISKYTFSAISLCVRRWQSFSPISSKWTTAETMNIDANTRQRMKKLHLFQLWESTSSRFSLTVLNWSISSSQSSTNFCNTKGREKTCLVRKLEKVSTVWRVVISIWMLLPFSRTKSLESSSVSLEMKSCQFFVKVKMVSSSAPIYLPKLLKIWANFTTNLSKRRRWAWTQPMRFARYSKLSRRKKTEHNTTSIQKRIASNTIKLSTSISSITTLKLG